MAQVMISEIRPDYLTLANEPSTEAHVVGFAISVQQYTQFINETLRELGRPNTLIGAGSGTWDDIVYVRSFAQNTGLDFIDLHIYPPGSRSRDYLQAAVEMAELARANKKAVIVGEFWLYKASSLEISRTPDAVEVFARNPYSFWIPLDGQMLEVITKFARRAQVKYISPFWSQYFFGYIPYDDRTRSLPPMQLTRLVNAEATKNLASGTLTDTGLKYQQIIQNTSQK